MNAIRDTVAGLCAVVILLGALSAFVPGHTYQKPLRFLFSAIILLTALSVFSIDLRPEDFKLHNIDGGYAYYDTDQALLEAAQDNLVASAKEILAEQDIPCNDVTVNMHISEGRRISISGINIFLDKAQSTDRQSIRNLIKENFGIYPTLIFL